LLRKLASKTMDNKHLEIMQTIALMFKAAPGAHYLNQFVHFVDNSGNSVGTLAALLAQTDIFQQALYSNSLSNRNFSVQICKNLSAFDIAIHDFPYDTGLKQ